MSTRELDLRTIPRPERHSKVFALFNELAVDESFDLLYDHDPKPLREQFDTALPGGSSWEIVVQEIHNWRIRITKVKDVPVPDNLLTPPALAPADGAEPIKTIPLHQRES